MADVATLMGNIASYEASQNILEADKWGRYVVFYDGEMQGDFPDFPKPRTTRASGGEENPTWLDRTPTLRAASISPVPETVWRRLM